MLLGELLEQIANSTSTSDLSGTGPLVQQQNTTTGKPVPTVVGAPAEKLDSVNELIKADHIYHKESAQFAGMQASTPYGGDGTTQLTVPVTLPSKSSQKVNIIVTLDSDSKSKTKSPQNNTVMKSVSQPTGNLDNDLNLDELSDLIDLSEILKEDLCAAPPSKGTVNDTCTVVASLDTNSTKPLRSGQKRKLVMPVAPTTPEQSLATPDLFHFNTSDIPLSPVTDSCYSSELSEEAASPRSDISSVLEGDMWEESFTELFPSLL